MLETEIEKYPFFYSLHALKLLALKRANHHEFEKQLHLVSTLNSNKGLFYLLNTNKQAIKKNKQICTFSHSTEESQSETTSQIVELSTEEILTEKPITETVLQPEEHMEILSDATSENVKQIDVIETTGEEINNNTLLAEANQIMIT